MKNERIRELVDDFKIHELINKRTMGWYDYIKRIRKNKK